MDYFHNMYLPYRIKESDFELWNASENGNLMYSIFNICKICKGQLKENVVYEISNGKDTYKVEDLEINNKPICVSCIRNDKMSQIWI